MNENINKRGRGVSVARAAAILAAAVALTLVEAGTSQAALSKSTFHLMVQYNNNNNIDGVDLKSAHNPVTASYIDYLLGVDWTLKQGRSEFTLGGYGGYEQYLTVDGDLEDVANTSPGDYNFITLGAQVDYRYYYTNIIFHLSDAIQQSRDLQRVFGAGTDALNYRYLFTDNIASADLTYKPTTRDTIVGRYSYESLTFATPENDTLAKPSESFEHRGAIRNEYYFNERVIGIIDLQGGQRTFTDTYDPLTGQNEKSADYNVYQGALGLRYIISNRAYVEGVAGAAQRNYFNLSDVRVPVTLDPANPLAHDLENMTDPIFVATLAYLVPNRVKWSLVGERGISTYGNNIFFSYFAGISDLTYYLTPKLSLGLYARYEQALFDMEKNGLEWLWDHDRADNVIYAKGFAHWAILQKGGQDTLALEAGYNYRGRDSNIDGDSDYNSSYVQNTLLAFPTYEFGTLDSQIGIWYVQVNIQPTILLGK